MMKYNNSVYSALKEIAKCDGDVLTNETIDNMARYTVLSKYLEWEGIIGYTSTIANITGIKE